MNIGWKVSTLTLNVASVRYRALLPILALESEQVHNRLFSSGLESHLDGLDALVIVKSFTPDDLFLAQSAASKGIRVVFDLCDNIFVEAYGRVAGKVSPTQLFDVIAAKADAIVVTTEPLATIVRHRVPHVPVTVIPDGVETFALLEAMDRLLREANAREKAQRVRILWRKARNLLVRLREEGAGLAVRLLWRVVNRGQRMLRKYLHRWILRWPRNDASPAPRKQQAATYAPIRWPRDDAAPARAAGHAKTILWFGNHGAPHANFGMLDLLEIRDALETVASGFDVELVVISNHREKYEEYIRPLRIPSRYLDWSPQLLNQWLGKADVVVVPNTLDPFSVCKSANRSVLAVSQGVPVVATSTAALNPLAPYIHTGDTVAGLERYLRNREAGRRDAEAAFALAQDAFGQEAIAEAWQAVLAQPRSAQRAVTPAQCIVALNLIQDLDLAVPVLDAWADSGVSAQVWCSATLVRKSPRVLATLEKRRIDYRALPDELPTGSVVFPDSARCLLTVTETNLGPHRFTRKLTELALARDLTVATLQHGFENVGLTYEDAVHPIDRVTIKAQRIYTWGGPETLHPRLDASTRARCIPLGCTKPATTKPADLGQLLPKGRPVVGVFENLHWHRYDDTYRQAFLDAVTLLAEGFPEVTFLIKPHHAGVWLTHRYEGQRPAASNLVIADPQTPAWEHHTASALLGSMTAVITSPSTVALDAARQGLPVAVFAGGLCLPNYHPLPLLRAPSDWAAVVNAALDLEQRGTLESAAAAFVARVLVDGDGAKRIAADLAAASRISATVNT